jgi:hypothetical protein
VRSAAVPFDELTVTKWAPTATMIEAGAIRASSGSMEE